MYSRMLALACLLAAGPAMAQGSEADEAAWEAQRCIWSCQANTGSWEEYEACTRKFCSGGEPVEETPPAADLTPATPQGSPELEGATPIGSAWQFGDHPEFGSSAYIDTPSGSVALTCIYRGTDALVADMLALRMSRSFGGSGPATVLFGGQIGTSTLDPSADGLHLEVRGNSCSTNLESLQKARYLVVVPGRIASVQMIGSIAEVTIDSGGEQSIVTSAAEAARLPGSTAISLRGSSAAIKRLLATCPAARLDIENNCGI